MLKNYKTNLKLFSINFYISAFTFGGGYVVIPMIRKSFVEDLKLITEDDLMDMAAIAQSTPGAIAVNLSVLVGYKISKWKGAVLSCLGAILPPLIIIAVISNFYDLFRTNLIVSAVLKGMEAGVAATIVDLVIDMVQALFKEDNVLFKIMAPLAFILSFIFNVDVILIIIGCAIIALIQTILFRKDASHD